MLQIDWYHWNAKIPGKIGSKNAATTADGSVHEKWLWCQPVKSIVKAAKLNGNHPEGNPLHNRWASKMFAYIFMEVIEIEIKALIL